MYPRSSHALTSDCSACIGGCWQETLSYVNLNLVPFCMKWFIGFPRCEDHRGFQTTCTCIKCLRTCDIDIGIHASTLKISQSLGVFQQLIIGRNHDNNGTSQGTSLWSLSLSLEDKYCNSLSAECMHGLRLCTIDDDFSLTLLTPAFHLWKILPIFFRIEMYCYRFQTDSCTFQNSQNSCTIAKNAGTDDRALKFTLIEACSYELESLAQSIIATPCHQIDIVHWKPYWSLNGSSEVTE